MEIEELVTELLALNLESDGATAEWLELQAVVAKLRTWLDEYEWAAWQTEIGKFQEE